MPHKLKLLDKEISFTDTIEVFFKNVTDNDISWYVENEKYLLNRAGYSIAGKTSIFVDKIVGDYYNILGMNSFSLITPVLNSLTFSLECKPMLVIYTTDDVCKMFHLGKVKCLELFRRDDFPAQKYGRGYGVEAEALKKYMSTRHYIIIAFLGTS